MFYPAISSQGMVFVVVFVLQSEQHAWKCSLSHQLNSNYDTYCTPKPDFSYHLVCLNSAALLQSNASSFSDLPPSDQQQNQVPPYSFFNNQFCSDVGHNTEEEICRNFHFIWTLIINTINYFINTILIFRFFPVFLLRCFIEKKNAEFLCSWDPFDEKHKTLKLCQQSHCHRIQKREANLICESALRESRAW